MPSSTNLAHKKMVKRNSCNEHVVHGLTLVNQGSNENKYTGTTVSKKASHPPVKRYNSNVIKEESYVS